MAESKLAALSMDYAVKVLKLFDSIKGHYSLVSQLERSATSIGANIREANYAHSCTDQFRFVDLSACIILALFLWNRYHFSALSQKKARESVLFSTNGLYERLRGVENESTLYPAMGHP